MRLTPERLQTLADRINTGTDSPDTSRALIVFNMTDQPLSGVAVFHASMSWPRNLPLPPILVSDIDGSLVFASVRDLTDGPDAKGRANRRQLSFALHFAVSDVPANGWRTYIAAYTDPPSSPALSPPAPPMVNGVRGGGASSTPGLNVVETLRHGGDLPPVGNF